MNNNLEYALQSSLSLSSGCVHFNVCSNWCNSKKWQDCIMVRILPKWLSHPHFSCATTALSCTVYSMLIAYMIVALTRFLLRTFVFAYTGYMFEERGKVTLSTKLWMVCKLSSKLCN